MELPPAIEALWQDLEAARRDVLREAEGLTPEQAAWQAGPAQWSIAQILHHLALAEVATGKLTSKLLRERAADLGPFPPGLDAVTPLPPWPAAVPAEAPPMVRPEAGRGPEDLVAQLRTTRARSRESLERLAGVDPRPLTFPHFALGVLDLAQWWALQARHDRDHLAQIRRIRASPGFPAP